MSQAIKIGKRNEKQPLPTVSQSIPADFYRDYIPPTPKLGPIRPQLLMVDDNMELPPTCDTNFDLKIPHSLTNKYAISMPTNCFMKGPLSNKQNRFSAFSTNNNQYESKQNENKFNDNSKKMISGSFTCFQLMAQVPFKGLNPIRDEDTSTNISSTDSTFANDAYIENEEDEEDEEHEEDDEDNVLVPRFEAVHLTPNNENKVTTQQSRKNNNEEEDDERDDHEDEEMPFGMD